MDGSLNIVILTIIVVFVHSQTLPEVKHEQYACYGNKPPYSFSNANCSTNELIATIDVIVGSKPRNYSFDCPEVLIVQNDFPHENFEPCCRPDDGDECYGSLNASNQHFYFRENCTGKVRCPDVQVGRIPTRDLGCDESIFYTDTHNFIMYYYCIREDKVGYISSANLANSRGSALYLLGQKYPAEISLPASTCSIETDPGSFISIFALDIRLKENGGTCRQSITIIDGLSKKMIECDDNNLFDISIIYTSMSNSLTLEFKNNYGTGGYFWLGFTASSNGQLSLSCANGTGNETTTVSMTTDTSTNVSTEMSSTETTQTSTTSEKPGVTNAQPSKNEDSSTGVIVGAVVGLLLLLLLLVFIILCCIYKKKKKREKEKEENKQPIVDNEKTDRDEESNFPNIFGITLPPQKQNVLPPISTTFVKSENGKEKSKKKKRRRRKIDSEQDINDDLDDKNNNRDHSLSETQNTFSLSNGYAKFETTEETNENEEKEKHKKKRKRKKKNKIEPEEDYDFT